MLSTGPTKMDKAQVEFEIQLEQRLKTVLNTNPEELNDDESKPKKRRKKNSSNEGGEEQEKLPSRNKPKKRDPGLISFLNNYHKTMWIAKYNCTFVYEDADDDAEIGEEVIYVYLPVCLLITVIRYKNTKSSPCHVPDRCWKRSRLFQTCLFKVQADSWKISRQLRKSKVCLKDETFVVVFSFYKPCYCRQSIWLEQRRLG